MEGIIGAVWAFALEVSHSLAFRICELVKVRNGRGLQLVLQFVVFAVLVVCGFVVVGILLTGAMALFAA